MDGDQFRRLVAGELARLGFSAREAARRAGLPERSVRNVLDGHEPSVGRAAHVARALGLELQVVRRELDVRSPGTSTDGARHAAADRMFEAVIEALEEAGYRVQPPD